MPPRYIKILSDCLAAGHRAKDEVLELGKDIEKSMGESLIRMGRAIAHEPETIVTQASDQSGEPSGTPADTKTDNPDGDQSTGLLAPRDTKK